MHRQNSTAASTSDENESNEPELRSKELIITAIKMAELELIKAKEKAEENERNLLTINEEYVSINEELKQTNDELLILKEKAEESEAKYKSIVNSSPTAMHLYKLDDATQAMIDRIRFMVLWRNSSIQGCCMAFLK